MTSRARRRKFTERAKTPPLIREARKARDRVRHAAYGMNRHERRSLAARAPKAADVLADMAAQLR